MFFGRNKNNTKIFLQADKLGWLGQERNRMEESLDGGYDYLIILPSSCIYGF